MTTSRIATHGAGEGPIFGRERELAQLYELVDRIQERGAALLVRGEPGIGKSTLLAAACRRAEDAGIRVLRTTGVQSETQLPFAGLHQLVLPVLAQTERLPTPQRVALLAAFGMVEIDEAPDRFLIALAVLELLSDAAQRAPLLVVAEDAHWLDRSTADVLTFVARRVEHERIVVLVASREGVESFFDDAGLPELRLGGLDEAAAESLLDAHGRQLAPAVRVQLREQTGGNPLALVELPVLLGTDKLGGRSLLPTPLPLTARLERAFGTRAASMPPRTRNLLLLAAVDQGGDLGEILAAAAVIDGAEPTVEDLTPAVAARLVLVDGTSIGFRHPLVRSAVYQMASLAERHAAHAAVAEILTDQPDRQVWHRAAALVGPDERVAASLEAAATRARRRGAIGVAISALERAVGLSEDLMLRAQWLLDAAELAYELGRFELVLGLVTEAELIGLSVVDHQRAMLIREAFDTSEDTVGVEQVIEVTERTWHHDPEFAMNLLRRAAGKSWWIGRSEERRELFLAAVERMGIPEGDAQRLAILAMVAPTRHAKDVLEYLSPPPEGDADPIAARVLGLAGYGVGHLEFAIDALTVAVDGLRARGRLTLLAQAIVTRALTGVQLGRFDLAVPDAEEGRWLAIEAGWPLFAESAHAVQALLAGLRGDADEAEAIVAEVEHAMLPRRARAVLSDVQLVRGMTALGAGRYVDAYNHLIRMFDPNDPAEHFRKKFWAIGELAEAALHSERRDEGRTALAQAEASTGPLPSPRLRIALEYARPLLAKDTEAEALFAAGLATDLTRWPFARARLQLAYGTWLRRQRRVAESRAYLVSAIEAFDALDALAWAERARHELRGAGVVTREPVRAATSDLTPQELQVARMAASGLSNREIGQQLYLSHRTVGAHLYRAFPKLGITSRGQLRDALDAELS
jgi:DNA-binding CsgD family transcriptional regulator/tetratricopeptide (TPR) repeat protein